MTSHHMISAEAVRDLPKTQFVDCRFRLGQHGAGLELYREGHIPGALYLDLDDDLSGPVRDDRLGGRHPLPERAVFEQSLQRAGLCGDAAIVVYDDGTGGAARAWWLLRHHGVPSQVLEGGIAAWDDDLDVGDAVVTPGDLVLGAERTDDLLDATGVQAALEAGRIVLDARVPERFRGEVEPMDPVAGHIVGARNAPFNAPDAIDGDVLTSAKPPVVYCGSGITAAALALRLAELGREDTQIYAGSWSDWCARGLAEPA
ncbi:MAG: rhodanese-like domain-containing protein [Thermoleophilia bacterium]